MKSSSVFNQQLISSFFKEQLLLTIKQFHHEQFVNQLIEKKRFFVQKNNFIVFTAQKEKQYFDFLRNQYFNDLRQDDRLESNIQQKTNQNEFQEKTQSEAFQSYIPLNINSLVLNAVKERQNNIQNNIKLGQLTFYHKGLYQKAVLGKNYTKLQNQKGLLQQQLQNLKKNIQISRSQKPGNEDSFSNVKSLTKQGQRQREKRYFQYVKQEKLQKQKRKKLLQTQLQKQYEKQRKKMQQQKAKNEKQQQIKLQQKRTKQKQLQEKRQKQKQLRLKHESYFNQQKAKLFYKEQTETEDQFSQSMVRYQSMELSKLKEQKKKICQSVQKAKIDQHQKIYRQAKEKIKQERQQKMQQIRKIQAITNLQSRIKFRSSFSFQLPSHQYQKRKSQLYQNAKDKRQRILSYRDRVKSNFIPQIDQKKRKQFLSLFQQLELDKKGQHYKKKILKNGEIVIQKLQIKNQKQVGKKYLQSVKQMVQKARLKQKSSGQNDFIEQGQNAQSKEKKDKKPIDYLKQRRQRNKDKESQFTTNSFRSPKTTEFFQHTSKSKPVSQSQNDYDKKLKKLEILSQKLMQKTKQQQMLLKHGKFQTSQEILNKKQQIDRNYIDLLNLKLQMIERDEGELQ